MSLRRLIRSVLGNPTTQKPEAALKPTVSTTPTHDAPHLAFWSRTIRHLGSIPVPELDISEELCRSLRSAGVERLSDLESLGRPSLPLAEQDVSAIRSAVGSILAKNPPPDDLTLVDRDETDLHPVAISDLAVSRRTMNALRRHGFWKLANVSEWNVKAFVSNLRNFGPIAMYELDVAIETRRRKLPKVGSALSQPPPPQPVPPPDPEPPAEVIELDILSRVSAVGVDLTEVRTDDPRFTVSIQPVRTFAELAETENLTAGEVAEANAALEHLINLRQNTPTLRQELEAIVRAVSANERNAGMYIARHGLDGGEPQTLEQVGQDVGLTRERVRQVQRKIDLKLEGRRPYLASWDSIAELLEENAPCTDVRLGELLVERGLAEDACEVGCIRKVVDLGWRELDIEYQRDIGWGTHERASALHKAVQLARKLAGTAGFVGVQQLVSEMNDIEPVDVHLARAALGNAAGLQRIDENWFFNAGTTWNPLLKRLEKLITVIGPLPVRECARQLRRYRRRGGEMVPPTPILEQIVSAVGDPFLVEDGMVSLVDRGRSAPHQVDAGKAEGAMVELLRERGPMSGTELFATLFEMGYVQVTINTALGTSILIKHIDRNVYGLPGQSVDDVSPAVREESVERVVLGVDQPAPGQVRVRYRVSKGLLRNGVGSVRTRLGLDGVWPATDDEDNAVVLTVRESALIGLAGFFERRRPKVGDEVHITFHTRDQRAVLQLFSFE